jgi:hypothetical protein
MVGRDNWEYFNATAFVLHAAYELCPELLRVGRLVLAALGVDQFLIGRKKRPRLITDISYAHRDDEGALRRLLHVGIAAGVANGLRRADLPSRTDEPAAAISLVFGAAGVSRLQAR